MRDESRKARLKHLIATDYGTPVAFALAIGKDKARVSQMTSPKHPFGELAARNLAEVVRLPADWFNNEWPTPQEAKKLGGRVSEPYPANAPVQIASARPSNQHLLVQLGETLRLLDATDRSMAGVILHDLVAEPGRAAELAEKFDRLLGGDAQGAGQHKTG